MATAAPATARGAARRLRLRVGWAVTRHAPEPVAERLLERRRRPGLESARHGVRQLEAQPAACRPGPRRPTSVRDCSSGRCGRTSATGTKPSGCRRGRSSRIVDTVVTTNERPLRDGFARGSRRDRRPAAHGQLGPRGCLGLPDGDAGLDRRRAAPAGVPLQPVRRLPRGSSGWRSSRSPAPATRSARCGPHSKRGRLVCLLADRDLTGAGVEVALLGERPGCREVRPPWPG